MKTNLIYIIVIALSTNLLRVLPAMALRKPIKNRFIRSFLHYVPYVTLAVMTVPSIITAVPEPIVGSIALVAGLVAAWLGLNLPLVAGICCLSVFLLNLFIP